MADTDGSGPVVLVVDDDREVADLYTRSLLDEFEVLTAYSGEEALELADDSVTVVLLDRRMPGLTGDEVLEELRSRGYDGQVVLLTAVEPDFDVIEMGFDDYLVKPVSPAEVTSVVTRMVALDDESASHQAFSALVSKKLALESKKSTAELQASEEYRSLLDTIDEHREEIGSEAAARIMANASAAVFGGMNDQIEELARFDDSSSTQAPAADAVDVGDQEAGPGDDNEATAGEDGRDGAEDDDAGGEAVPGDGSGADEDDAAMAFGDARAGAPDAGRSDARSYATHRETEPLYAALLEALPDPVFVVAPDRSVVDCNPAFCATFGYEPEEIEGEPVSVLYASEAAPASGDGPITLEYERQDGGVFEGETTLVHLREEGGRTVAMAAIVRPTDDGS